MGSGAGSALISRMIDGHGGLGAAAGMIFAEGRQKRDSGGFGDGMGEIELTRRSRRRFAVVWKRKRP